MPAGVVGLWIFTQAVFSVSTWVSAANFTGLLGHAAAGLQAGAPQSLWFSTSLSLFGSRLGGGSRSILDILNELSVFGSDYVVQLVWQAVLGVVLLGWLAAWLSRRRTNGRMHVPASGTQS